MGKNITLILIQLKAWININKQQSQVESVLREFTHSKGRLLVKVNSVAKRAFEKQRKPIPLSEAHSIWKVLVYYNPVISSSHGPSRYQIT